MTQKTALITGITGQDGAYLSKLLLDRGYRVIGITTPGRGSSFRNLEYLGVAEKVEQEACDLMSLAEVERCLRRNAPHEVYNFAAQSSVGRSFQEPRESLIFNSLSVLNLLEGIRNTDRSVHMYQASSSEMFGRVCDLPINEQTPMHPLSPYAVSKAAAHWTAVNYRESYGVFVSCGICFNHESFLRKEGFFVKKMIQEALRVKNGTLKSIHVGNIDVRRDFGYGPSYVEAMWLMMQQREADDYLICSGRSILLRDIIEHILERFGLGSDRIVVDPSLIRPNEIQDIYGDNSKARSRLGWRYEMDFLDVLDLLIDEEMAPRRRSEK